MRATTAVRQSNLQFDITEGNRSDPVILLQGNGTDHSAVIPETAEALPPDAMPSCRTANIMRGYGKIHRERFPFAMQG
jgi:hypothetical protein